MKKLLFLLILIPILGYGQKIKENKIDKFTGQHIISTSMEVLWKPKPFTREHKIIEFKLRWVNGEWMMPTLISVDEILKYEEGDGLILLLDNGETIILETLYTGVSSPNYEGNLQGAVNMLKTFNTVFQLSPEDIEKLKKYKITDVRISALGTNIDLEIQGKNQELVMKMIDLIEKTISN